MITPSSLRAIRAMRNITQAELASLAGISPASIANFESGASDMRASTIVKLCAALQVSVIYRVNGTEITGP